MSAGVPSRCMGMLASAPSSRLGFWVVILVNLVSTSPGAMPSGSMAGSRAAAATASSVTLRAPR